ncbi:MAG: DUF4411 family protein [Immundisolibacter sp.]|uniref:DUF4411 family protein n=1 Tax=Immundisolibacter sp. TaxID=1934948 RepID=UPI003EE292FA
MQVFDASSAVYAWDNYPIEQFPSLWTWLSHPIATGELTISTVALKQTGDISPECAGWLRAQPIRVLPITDDITMDALRIKALLDIEGERYGTGVDENDLLIIATARAHAAELVTNEGLQPSLPKNRRNYKIPAVCDLPEVNAASLSFLDYFKRSRVVFG